jgi:hypothetical protein
MSGALNFVEILATLYLMAIMGALGYVAFRAFMAKHGPFHLFANARTASVKPTLPRRASNRSTISR